MDINTYRDLAAAAIEDLKNYANDERPERRLVSYREYAKDLERLDNTRPELAATDTGLKTIGFVPPMFVEGKGADYNDIFRSVSIAENYTAVVTRSQAAKLLAEKDAQIAGWMESGELWTAEIRELQANLADAEKALDAIAGYSDRPQQEWREKHPELAAIMQAVPYRPEMHAKTIGKFARAVLERKKED